MFICVETPHDTFTFRLNREGFELKDTTTLKTVICESCYFKPAMIDSVNSEEYTGLVTLVVIEKKDSLTEETQAAFEAAMAEAALMDENTYTAASWKVYSDAVAAAKDVAQKENVTETELAAALKAVNDAKAALASKSSLVTLSLSTKAYVYDAKSKSPSITVKDSNDKVLKEGTDYLVTGTRKATKPGVYTVKVTGIGDCAGTLVSSFKISVKTTGISKLKAGRKSFSVKVYKRSGTNVTGYQVRYSRYSSMKNAKTATISKKYKSVSKTVKKLSAKKRYYVQVRAYKTISGKKYYSAWSRTKSVRTK